MLDAPALTSAGCAARVTNIMVVRLIRITSSQKLDVDLLELASRDERTSIVDQDVEAPEKFRGLF